MSYGEQIAVIPRNYPFNFRVFGSDCRHYVCLMTTLCSDTAKNRVKARSSAEEQILPRLPIKLLRWFSAEKFLHCRGKGAFGQNRTRKYPVQRQLPARTSHWIIADKDRNDRCRAQKQQLKIYDAPVIFSPTILTF